MDEPDAHLHVILQKQVCDRLRSLTARKRCQLLIASHAETLTVLRWKRYETESYLLDPNILMRFIEFQADQLFAAPARRFLEDLPKGALRDAFLESTPASKTVLPELFKSAGLQLDRQEYYLIAEMMAAEEIPEEVIAKLDAIAEVVL